ncbi:eCIS core domain-containing protein [Chitinophaga vietnamensis]|uniref:eCIS core domain-containing protein n=1 Tax=Chitinophaga vietnamensis TaxID=2593957 RepID=UPI001178A21B|nr:DUF4157 domain-containing protein [Chitinophaga vietnamensis]
MTTHRLCSPKQVSPERAGASQNASGKIHNECFRQLPLQRKLSVGAVDDPLEREADAMADAVISRKPLPSATFIQRKCQHCEEEDKVMRHPVSAVVQQQSTPAVDAHTESRIHASKGGGAALPENVRQSMETRMGQDFSAVRIHTDGQAAGLSRSLHAQAFTVGNDIYFDAGKFDPGSSEGAHLLAHELWHTVQQGEGGQQQAVQRFAPNPPVTVTPQQIAEMRALIQQVTQLMRAGAVTAEETAAITTAGAEAEAAIVTATEMAAAGATATAVGEGALVTAGGLAADDVTGIGVADDVAIPFVLLGAAVAFGVGFAIGYSADAIAAAWQKAAAAVARTVSLIRETIKASNRRNPRRNPQPAPIPEVDPYEDPYADPETSTSNPDKPRNDCFRMNRTSLVCEGGEKDPKAALRAFLERYSARAQASYDPSKYGAPKDMGKFKPGIIDACSKGPGQSIHFETNTPGYPIVSIFGCVCCNADGTSGIIWQGAHDSAGDMRKK